MQARVRLFQSEKCRVKRGEDWRRVVFKARQQIRDKYEQEVAGNNTPGGLLPPMQSQIHRRG